MPTYVRDNRGGNWWWAHNAIIDFYGPQIGAYSVAIYCALCRYAGREQQTWVSQRLLREQLGLSDNTVRRALHTLRDARLIAIEEQTDERGRSTRGAARIRAKIGHRATRPETPPKPMASPHWTDAILEARRRLDGGG